MTYEHCARCQKITGRSGIGEDSLYSSNGYGPFCEDCWDELICEAAEIAVKTGFTPRQLAEQRAELLAALRSLVENEDETPSWNQRVAARAVIAKATGKGAGE